MDLHYFYSRYLFICKYFVYVLYDAGGKGAIYIVIILNPWVNWANLQQSITKKGFQEKLFELFKYYFAGVHI